MASLGVRHHGILSVLDDDDSNNITMKVGSLLRRRSVSADMSINTWFAPAQETPPYVHPIVKKSASLKSLESCTESLGSESGSDGFSSLQEEEDQKVNTSTSAMQLITSKKMKKINKGNPKPFPPPLSSLSYNHHHHHHHQEGQGRQPLRVRSHRDLGRLVLEATALPLHTNNFQAQRQHGRLLLSLTHKKDEDEEEDLSSLIGTTLASHILIN